LKLHLIRHARGIPRSVWRLEGGADELLRPLSALGHEQAEALAQELFADPPRRLLASPAVRCQQTLEPLAMACDLPIEVEERLAEGEEAERVLELLPSLGPGPVALSTHVGVIAGLLQLLDPAGVDAERPGCRKGAFWTLDGPGYAPASARYVEPVQRGRRRAEPPQSVRAACLDLGSTSFNLLIADVGRDGSIRPVVREKVMLRLGEVMATRDKIPGEVTRRTLEVARELRRIAAQEKVQRFLPVATAALREARNGRKVADKIGKVLGEPVRILSGEEEARVIFRAFQRRLDLGPEPALGLDLGGGSLEIALGSSRGVEREVTLPLGAVRLKGELVAGDPMTAEEAGRLRARVREALAPHAAALRGAGAERAVAAGGSVRGLARLVSAAEGGEALPRELPAAKLRALADALRPSDHAGRLAMPGMRRRRADLLPTAAWILTAVAETLDVEAFTLCDWGLREGVLLEALSVPA